MSELVTNLVEIRKNGKEDLKEQIEIIEARFNKVNEMIAMTRDENAHKHSNLVTSHQHIQAEIDHLGQKDKEYASVKQSITLSVADRNRLDELTDFYRHLNGVIETIIDKFSTMERVTNKFLKTQSFN